MENGGVRKALEDNGILVWRTSGALNFSLSPAEKKRCLVLGIPPFVASWALFEVPAAPCECVSPNVRERCCWSSEQGAAIYNCDPHG